jgi:hypothetical protein
MQHQLPFPQIGDAGLAAQVRGQKTVHKPREGAKIARLLHQRLKFAVGRKNPVDFG